MRSIGERDALVLEHLSLAENLASKRYITVNKAVQLGDLLSAAYTGLLDAASRFDLSKSHKLSKSPFKTYARRRISGEINDYLRSCSWGTRNNPQYMQSIDSYYGRGDSDRVDSSGGDFVSVANFIPSKNTSVVDDLNRREVFNKLIRSLPRREKEVFKLRYLEDLTMKEVADRVGVSESRVSQIISQSTEYLCHVWGDRSCELWEEITSN